MKRWTSARFSCLRWASASSQLSSHVSQDCKSWQQLLQNYFTDDCLRISYIYIYILVLNCFYYRLRLADNSLVDKYNSVMVYNTHRWNCSKVTMKTSRYSQRQLIDQTKRRYMLFNLKFKHMILGIFSRVYFLKRKLKQQKSFQKLSSAFSIRSVRD